MDISVLNGKILTEIKNNNNEELVFTIDNNKSYKMFHEQDCCENVTIEDICGDLDDLLGTPILQAEESVSGENPEGITKDYQDSFTWTFYKLAIIKGSVTIGWYGESNGYYSESVDFEEISE